MPPPPTPWIHLPTRICVKSFAIPATREPTKKNVMEKRRIGRRPKMVLNVAVVGWKTVLARRKEVPLQKACIAVPWRVFDIIWLILYQ
jgi:hypothetical protein